VDGADTRWVRLEETVAGLRNRAAELAQSRVRDEREMNSLDQRLRDLEGKAITLAAEIGTAQRQLDELSVLRERVNRFSGELDENKELAEASTRQLRQEVDGQREAGNDANRRLQSSEKGLNDLRERLAVFDEGIRRVNAEGSEIAHRMSQLENGQVALGARISANTDGLRRAASEESTREGRIEALERQMFSLTERVELSYQNLRRVQETADQWDDLRNNVEALRGRVEESLQVLDASKAIVSSVQRGFEALEERIGNIERVGEQLRVRDARRERSVASLSDKIEGVSTQSAQEQERFVALQEQIRRRQIEELEQEIRELKSYLRVRGDD
jgi:chromosome segregation ATPase